MIKIFSIFLNISALVLGFYSLFFILGRVNSFESGNERIAEIQKEDVVISQQREKIKKGTNKIITYKNQAHRS